MLQKRTSVIWLGICFTIINALKFFSSSNEMTKNTSTTKSGNVGHVRLMKIQISLRNSAVLSESSSGAFYSQWCTFLHVVNEHCDQTARMCSFIWVFVGSICPKVRLRTLRRIHVYNITSASSRAVVPVIVLFFVALWFIRRGDLY